MNGTGNLKVLCNSAETLQERIRRFPNEGELLAAVRAVGILDPSALLAYVRSASIERQSYYVLVPVLWDVGDLSHYRGADSDDVSLLKIDQQLAHDSIERSRLFQSAGNRYMGYLSLWAQELNRRGDEMFQQYRSDDEGLTRGLARFIASLECSNTITCESMRIEELLGVPMLWSPGNRGGADRSAVLSLVTRLAEIKLNGTFMGRMKAEVDCLPDSEEGRGCSMGPRALDAIAPSGEGPYQVEVEGQRFYLDIEAQELGSALCLAGQVAGA